MSIIQRYHTWILQQIQILLDVKESFTQFAHTPNVNKYLFRFGVFVNCVVCLWAFCILTLLTGCRWGDNCRRCWWVEVVFRSVLNVCYIYSTYVKRITDGIEMGWSLLINQEAVVPLDWWAETTPTNRIIMEYHFEHLEDTIHEYYKYTHTTYWLSMRG